MRSLLTRNEASKFVGGGMVNAKCESWLLMMMMRRMTIGWIEEWVHNGQIRENMDAPWPSLQG